MFDQRTGGLQAGFELAQQVIDRPRALFAATHVVVQAGNAQVFGQLIEAGNEPEFVATACHLVQAGPAGEGG
ncbi:hypothetical protein D3C87_1698680 [compost metagenome]